MLAAEPVYMDQPYCKVKVANFLAQILLAASSYMSENHISKSAIAESHHAPLNIYIGGEISSKYIYRGRAIFCPLHVYKVVS